QPVLHGGIHPGEAKGIGALQRALWDVGRLQINRAAPAAATVKSTDEPMRGGGEHEVEAELHRRAVDRDRNRAATATVRRYGITSGSWQVSRHVARLQRGTERRIVHIDIAGRKTPASIRRQSSDDREEARVEVGPVVPGEREHVGAVQVGVAEGSAGRRQWWVAGVIAGVS